MTDLSKVPTRDLIDELATREGVTEYGISHNNEIILSEMVRKGQFAMAEPNTLIWGVFGPARILVVVD